jgi:glycosyltransferase involved in cell wall biosynthesis
MVDEASSERQGRPPLRIAMVVPPWYELPPPGYGGIEQMCAALTDALVAHGHDVTVLGAGTKTGTAARFHGTVTDLQYDRMGQTLPELVHAVRVDRLIDQGSFDVVHDHTMVGLLTAPRRPIPTVATVHGCPTGELGDYLRGIDRAVGLVAISNAQRRLGVGLPWAATVHNGLATTDDMKTTGGLEATAGQEAACGQETAGGPESDGLDTADQPEATGEPEMARGPVLWLARFTPDKGPDLAIRACQEAGLPLVLAGKCNEPFEQRYLDEKIAPMLHPGVRLVTNPDRRQCEELMLSARCLLMPIRWDEPFGMVMLEAMASGTPVVALNRGAVPELVRHGETGLICEDPAGLPKALREADTLDPAACAEHVRTAFSADLMARRYERVYRHWAATGPLRQSRRTPAATVAG